MLEHEIDLKVTRFSKTLAKSFLIKLNIGLRVRVYYHYIMYRA